MFTAILAQDPAAKAPAGGEQPAAPFWMNPLFLVGIMVLFFFVVMYPAQRRAKREQANMLANLKPRKMRFGVSEGMILSAGNDGGGLFLLDADAGAEPGMPVR